MVNNADVCTTCKYICNFCSNNSLFEVPFEERTVIKGPKQKVRSNSILFIDGKLIPGPAPLLMVYHKPKFMLSVMEDDKKYLDQQRRHLGQVLHPRYARAGMFNISLFSFLIHTIHSLQSIQGYIPSEDWIMIHLA